MTACVIVPVMARQWRIEFEGAYYHVLSRGNDRRDIFSDNDDRILFLETLGIISCETPILPLTQVQFAFVLTFLLANR